MKDGSLTLDETGAGETADTTADGQDAVPETVENNDALADDTAPQNSPPPERWCVDLAEIYEKLELLPEKQL